METDFQRKASKERRIEEINGRLEVQKEIDQEMTGYNRPQKEQIGERVTGFSDWEGVY